jgi:Raf kinase inhibitor-like YbhB/YbcL family protein
MIRANLRESSGIIVLGLVLASIALTQTPAPAHIAVSSTAFQSGEKIPEQFTCKGANQNPPLRFQGIPSGAKSLALIVGDPDAPGGLFTHWLVWNIAPATTQIGGNSVPPAATQGTNDFGQPGYGGPCPPSGIHRYYFRLFALDRKLDLKAGAKRREIDQAIAGHVLARGELMVRCSH